MVRVSFVFNSCINQLYDSTSYIVDFEDCEVYTPADHNTREYYTYWWDTWFLSWGLVKYELEDNSDGSNFNDYETPYSVVGPPLGDCPCHSCARDSLASDNAQSTTPASDKNPIPSTL